MRRYILNRLFQFIPLLIGMTFISFLIIQISPGDYFTQLKMNPEISPETIENMRKLFGLDKPVIIQYFYWLKNIFSFNLGVSFSYHVPVSFLIKVRLKNTIALSIFSIFLTWIISIPLGIYGAIKDKKIQERILSFFAYIGISLPGFFIAMLVIFFISKTAILPLGGTTSIFYENASNFEKFIDYLKHLLVPGLILTLSGIGSLYRLMKNNFLETLNSPYIFTAYAKGIPTYKIYFKHALRNAINPMITIFGYELSGILSGAGLVEIITGWPGMGRLVLEGVLSFDLYLVMASLLIGGILLILGNLLADILLALTDPRVRLR
ncbi:MAG: ABC transporter permease [Candidatus Omnitrophica bacterium]|nr:ABC transporter permease [Candidatus Omnitrophota bacterium]MCM8809194.1 ABC transporter permease [Candidatus Omnitrophota bacterium]MCM8810412.1 ABC transporter permease [Candidatus Omnitrophota bacterium]